MAGVAGMPGAAKVEADYDTYQEYFVEKIWPVVQDFYENLLTKSPKRQRDGAIGGSFGDGVFVKLKLAGECRNVSCNLTWTGPVDNTNLQKDISYDDVSAFAADFFVTQWPCRKTRRRIPKMKVARLLQLPSQQLP